MIIFRLVWAVLMLGLALTTLTAQTSSTQLKGGVSTEVDPYASKDPRDGKPQVMPKATDGMGGRRCIPLAPNWQLMDQDASICFWFVPFAQRMKVAIVDINVAVAMQKLGSNCSGYNIRPGKALCSPVNAPASQCAALIHEFSSEGVKCDAPHPNPPCADGANGGGPDSTNYYGTCSSSGKAPFTGNIPPTYVAPAKRGPYYGNSPACVVCQQSERPYSPMDNQYSKPEPPSGGDAQPPPAEQPAPKPKPRILGKPGWIKQTATDWTYRYNDGRVAEFPLVMDGLFHLVKSATPSLGGGRYQVFATATYRDAMGSSQPGYGKLIQ